MPRIVRRIPITMQPVDDADVFQFIESVACQQDLKQTLGEFFLLIGHRHVGKAFTRIVLKHPVGKEVPTGPLLVCERE